MGSAQRNASSKVQKGFSLVEIMVTITVIALLAGIAAPGLSRVFKVSLKSTTRKIVGAVKYTFDQATLNHKTHRLVFDLDEGRYWVERLESKNDTLASTDLKSFEAPKPPGPRGNEKEEPSPGPKFAPVNESSAKPQDIPTGVRIKGIASPTSTRDISEGKAFIHFFPHGFAEPAAIYLTNGDDESVAYTLVIQPLTGKVTTYNELYNPFR